MFKANQIEITTSVFRYDSDRFALFDFTVVTWVTTQTIIFRHPQEGLRNIFLQPLKPSVWAVLALLTFVIANLITLSMRFYRDRTTYMSVARALVATVAIFCQQGLIEDLRRVSARMIVYVFIIFSLLIYQFYSSFIVSSLLTDSPKTINTIRQLIDSDLKVGMEDIIYNRDFFQTTKSQLAMELYKKKIEKDENFLGILEGLKLTKQGGFAFQVDTSYAYRLIRETFTDEEICELNEILLFPVRPLSSAVAKDSPFREFFVIALQRMIESGVVDYWSHRWSGKKLRGSKSDSDIKAVSMGQASTVFILLAVAIVASFMILAVEILHFKHYHANEIKLLMKRAE